MCVVHPNYVPMYHHFQKSEHFCLKITCTTLMCEAMVIHYRLLTFVVGACTSTCKTSRSVNILYSEQSTIDNYAPSTKIHFMSPGQSDENQ